MMSLLHDVMAAYLCRYVSAALLCSSAMLHQGSFCQL